MYFHGSGGLSDDNANDGPTLVAGGMAEKRLGPAHTVAIHGYASASAALPVNPERLPGAADTAYLTHHHDPAVNNGATVSSVTLNESDGIILLRPTHTVGKTTLGSTPSGGMSVDTKRGSKFTLSEAGSLASFTAYLDGAGGASGTESVRIAMYRDSSGVPGAKVAESKVVNISSGDPGCWVKFPAPTVALDPGSYPAL
jgi:hypothetical protein